MVNIIPKLNSREFPLILCQIWGGTYKRFMGERVKTFPRFVFVMKNGIVAAHRNNDLNKELIKFFANQVKDNKDYIKIFNKEYLQKFSELKDIWNKKWLEKRELIEFSQKMIDFWPAIYASMYIPRAKNRFRESDRTLMIELRRKIDIAADEATHIIANSLREIYPRLADLADYISLEELGSESINKKTLSKRASEIIFLVDDEIISEKRFRKLEKRFKFQLEEIKAQRNSKLIKGSIAFKGAARGRVRIIQKRAEIKSFQKGEILVSAMTVPDYLPAMKAASAFVTDEGGITCHAAIIAREMKKPCIIGMKIATKVLKNGDLVEVDANRGTVKIIKKAR